MPLFLTDINFFRVSAAIFILGVSTLSFMIPYVIQECNNVFFNVFQAFILGSMLGFGLVGNLYDGIVVNKSNSLITLMTSSSIFLLILCLEYVIFSISLTKEYSELRTNDNDIDIENADIEMITNEISNDTSHSIANNDTNNDSQTLTTQDNDDSDDDIGIQVEKDINISVHRKSRRYTFLVIILWLVVQGFFRGFQFSSIQHQYYVSFIEYLLEKAVLTSAISIMLCDLSLSIITLEAIFIVCFILTDSIGILFGTFAFTPENVTKFVSASFMKTTLTEYSTSATAGLLLYVSMVHMLNQFLTINLNAHKFEKLLNFSSLILGYAAVIAICAWLKY